MSPGIACGHENGQRGRRVELLLGPWRPANIKAEVQSLAGEGTALVRQILSAVDEMTPPQRVAAGEVVGQALAESDHLPDRKRQVVGELWLRDLELTA
ncbi:hypothetical protein ACIBAH_15525 [Streptomyces sp. NPDC051445]|uniref:hypothetical protein n=1 Tax=Streptomyces sp. NPDC051445 TaxID=3365653 RepID=UPI0037BDCEEE